METFYLFLIIFLFVLAVFDLSVGVSNDAVNFMNSAIGSKAASFKVIMVIAAIGIFVGASLSNGMMDIARHGIYQPQHFYFSEIMCICWLSCSLMWCCWIFLTLWECPLRLPFRWFRIVGRYGCDFINQDCQFQRCAPVGRPAEHR